MRHKAERFIQQIMFSNYRKRGEVIFTCGTQVYMLPVFFNPKLSGMYLNLSTSFERP